MKITAIRNKAVKGSLPIVTTHLVQVDGREIVVAVNITAQTSVYTFQTDKRSVTYIVFSTPDAGQYNTRFVASDGERLIHQEFKYDAPDAKHNLDIALDIIDNWLSCDTGMARKIICEM